MPKVTEKSTSVQEEEVIKIEDEDLKTEPAGHDAINPIEAQHHVQRLDEALQMLAARIDSGEIKDILKETLEEFKKAICGVMPSMEEANIIGILWSIKDLTCLMLYPQSDEVEGLLKELIHTKEVPSGSSSINKIDDEDTLTDEQRALIGELSDTLEMAYDHIGRACGILGILSNSLNT